MHNRDQDLGTARYTDTSNDNSFVALTGIRIAHAELLEKAAWQILTKEHLALGTRIIYHSEVAIEYFLGILAYYLGRISIETNNDHYDYEGQSIEMTELQKKSFAIAAGSLLGGGAFTITYIIFRYIEAHIISKQKGHLEHLLSHATDASAFTQLVKKDLGEADILVNSELIDSLMKETIKLRHSKVSSQSIAVLLASTLCFAIPQAFITFVPRIPVASQIFDVVVGSAVGKLFGWLTKFGSASLQSDIASALGMAATTASHNLTPAIGSDTLAKATASLFTGAGMSAAAAYAGSFFKRNRRIPIDDTPLLSPSSNLRYGTSV